MCTQIHIVYVHNVHNSTVVGRGGRGGAFYGVLFSSFSSISIFIKVFKVIIGIKLKSESCLE